MLHKLDECKDSDDGDNQAEDGKEAVHGRIAGGTSVVERGDQGLHVSEEAHGDSAKDGEDDDEGQHAADYVFCGVSNLEGHSLK